MTVGQILISSALNGYIDWVVFWGMLPADGVVGSAPERQEKQETIIKRLVARSKLRRVFVNQKKIHVSILLA